MAVNGRIGHSMGAEIVVELSDLRASGYCVTSRKFGYITRIDREDWKEVCKKKGYPLSADWYRRVVSRDTIVLSPSTAQRLPRSHDAERIGYLPKKIGVQP